MHPLQPYAERYRRTLLESVVPFWLQHSLDREHGGYFTCLDRDGTVYDTRKYLWLQGRNIWVYSRLYNELEQRPEWLDAARLGVEFLRRHGRDDQGRYYFSLTREGRPSFFQRKPYSAVFAALGLYEYGRATGDAVLQREAQDLFWQVDDWIEHPGLLGRPVYGGGRPTSTLSDILVRVMLVLDLFRDDPDSLALAVLSRCLADVSQHIDPRTGLLMESAAPIRRGQPSTPESRLFSAGSAVEVIWFLLHALERWPEADDGDTARWLQVMERCLEYGWDREHGGLYYFQDVEGRPPLQLEWNMKLWWPHTEAIYACVLAHTKTGGANWLQWLERLDSYAFQHFADPEHGEWFGYCDRYGTRTHDLKGNHYKGAYHMSRFLLFSMQRIAAAT